MLHRKITAHIMAFSLRLQQDVVVLSGQVGNRIDFGRIGENVVPPSLTGELTLPAGVKIGGIRAKLFLIQLIINLEIQTERHIVLIDNFHLGVLVKGHGEIATNRRSAAKDPFLRRIDRNLYRQGVKGHRHGMTDAEKVSKRHQHAGAVLTVPSDAQQAALR